MHQKIFVVIAVNFLIGVMFHSVVQTIDWSLVLILFSLFTTLMLVFVLQRYTKKMAIFGLLGMLSLFLGVMRFHISINQHQQDLDYFAEQGTTLVLLGRIVDEPITGRHSTKMIVHVQRIGIDQQWYLINQKIRVNTSPYQSWSYLDPVQITGVVSKPEPFETDQGRTFHYNRFLQKDGIFYTVSRAQIEPAFQHHLSYLSQPTFIQKITAQLYFLKNKFLDTSARFLPEPESGLLAGILFGKEGALAEPYVQMFRATGLMHIVVLSGYNVSLVIALFLILLKPFSRTVQGVAAVLGIIAFALLVGAGPTVVRASIMALFLVLARVIHRPYVVERSLLLALVIMVIINPWILVFDLSFQLSFLATYGLLKFSPIVESWCQWIPRFLEFRESAVATLSAQIIVSPLILYQIGEFSLIAPVVNVLVLFAVPWGMLFGFVGGLIAMFFPSLGVVALFPAYACLKYMMIVVEYSTHIPYASVSVPAFHISLMFLVYTVLAWWLWIYLPKKSS